MSMDVTIRNLQLAFVFVLSCLVSMADAREPGLVESASTDNQLQQPQESVQQRVSPVYRYVAVDKNDEYVLINGEGNIVARTGIVARGERSRGIMVFDFEGGIAPYRVGASYGWLNAKGERAIEPKFERLGTAREGYVPVKRNGLWGLYTIDGKVAIPARYDSISAVHEGLAVFTSRDAEQQKLTDEQRSRVELLISELSEDDFARREHATDALARFGSLAVPTLQEATQSEDSEVAARARVLLSRLTSDGQSSDEPRLQPLYGVMDVQGKVVIPPRFSTLTSFSEGLALARLPGDEKLGYVDKDGQWVIKPQFDWGYPFHNGSALVRIDGRYELRDRKDTTVLQVPAGLSIQAYHSGPRRLVVRKDKQHGFMDRQGRVIGDLAYDEVGGFHDGLAKVRIGQQWGYLNLDGDMAIKPQFGIAFDFCGPLAKFRSKDHCGFMNQKGEIVFRWSE
jgi:hypothetical protein